jgi:hypothetical protein
MPALDGFSLAHLDAIDDALQVGFWKERMWGTMFWGIEILVNGVGIDKYGFRFSYHMLCFGTVMLSLCIFPNASGNNSAYPQQRNEIQTVSQTRELFMLLCKTYFSSGIALVGNLAFNSLPC